MSQEQRQATIGDPMPSLRPESVDLVFSALADERRRVAVGYLADVDRAVTRDELVHQVAVETVDRGEADGDVRSRLATQFHHRHLPTLAAAGLVDYDEAAAVVYATERADRVSRWVGEP